MATKIWMGAFVSFGIPDTERLIFHCHASIKTSCPNQDNANSLRVEFKPRTMRVHNLPTCSGAATFSV